MSFSLSLEFQTTAGWFSTQTISALETNSKWLWLYCIDFFIIPFKMLPVRFQPLIKRKNKELFQVKEQFLSYTQQCRIQPKTPLFKPKTISTKLKSVTNCSIRNRPTRSSNFLPSKSKLSEATVIIIIRRTCPIYLRFQTQHCTLFGLHFLFTSHSVLMLGQVFLNRSYSVLFCELLSFSNRYLCLCLFIF